jgi:hypothetical protein
MNNYRVAMTDEWKTIFTVIASYFCLENGRVNFYGVMGELIESYLHEHVLYVVKL